MSAGNQQERLSSEEEKRWFLAGLIEGEGSCTISIKQHPTAKLGFIVDPEFFIYQHKNRRAVLELAINVFQSGRIHPKHGYPDVLVYAITSTKVIAERVVPFLERYMPYSARSSDYGKFGEAVRLFETGAHRTQEGMERIVRLAYSMNHDGKQRKRPLEAVLDRILRGHTPDAPTPVGAKRWSDLLGDKESQAEYQTTWPSRRAEWLPGWVTADA
jgi:hypothetical protein